MSKLNFFPHNIDIKILIVIQTKLSKLIVFREKQLACDARTCLPERL
jgi:hypothetical protein